MSTAQHPEPLRIGVLGASRIAESAIVGPANTLGHRLVAVAARDRDRAEDVGVLPGGEAQPEVGDVELGRAQTDDRRQSGERDEPVVRADDGRVDADAAEDRAGISIVFGNQLG